MRMLEWCSAAHYTKLKQEKKEEEEEAATIGSTEVLSLFLTDVCGYIQFLDVYDPAELFFFFLCVFVFVCLFVCLFFSVPTLR